MLTTRQPLDYTVGNIIDGKAYHEYLYGTVAQKHFRIEEVKDPFVKLSYQPSQRHLTYIPTGEEGRTVYWILKTEFEKKIFGESDKDSSAFS